MLVSVLPQIYLQVNYLMIMENPKQIQVLETLASLDRAIHSPHATTQVNLAKSLSF